MTDIRCPTTGEHAHSIPPGAYDLLFRRDYSFDDNIVDENRPTDQLPNGYRVLRRCVSVP